MFCNNCGTQNVNEAKFCMKCGAPMPLTNSAHDIDKNIDSTKKYISQYEDEEMIFLIRGKNPPKRRIFPKEKSVIPLLNSDSCDLLLTTKRLCLTLGNPNIKEPNPTNWFIPIGGGIGALANLMLQDAINGYKNSKFKKKHGDFYTSAEIDIMCLAGNAIYSISPLKVEIFNEKAGFFNTIGNDKKSISIAFSGEYNYQDRTIKGSILQMFSDSAKDMVNILKKISTESVDIVETRWNDDGDIKYISSRLS